MIKKVYFSLVLLSTFPLIPAVQLESGKDATGPTFPFAVLAHGLYLPSHRFFVAAEQAIQGNDFAVSFADSTSKLIYGLTPATVMVNNSPDQPNPLHGAAISHLALMGPWPVVAKRNAPSVLFLIDDLRNDEHSRKQIFQSSPIRDGNGIVARSLFALETIAASVLVPLEATGTKAAFAAVGEASKENELSLALLFFKKFTPQVTLTAENKDASASPDKKALVKNSATASSKLEKIKKLAADSSKDAPQNTPKNAQQVEAPGQNYYGWDIVDALTGAREFTPEGQPTGHGNKALLINRDTTELFINQPLSILRHVVDLHYDRDLGRLYVALQVIGGARGDAGARAVLVGSNKDGTLKFQAIAPATVFMGQTGIVGGSGSNTAVTIYKVRTLFTKTLLRYLIVAGGNGTDAALAQQVYALPLVDNVLSEAHGTLANVTSQPADLFSGESPYRFEGRVFATPALQPDEIFEESDSAARVGGNGILPGPITDIVVAKDAVMVSVEQAGNGFEPGIFSSQPMYDSLGRISGWSIWQRVAGTNMPIKGFSYDPALAVHWYIPKAIVTDGKSSQADVIKSDRNNLQALNQSLEIASALKADGKNSHSILNAPMNTISQSVYKTKWTDSKDPFSYFIATEFPPGLGGVQGIFDFPLTTASFSQIISKRLSLMVYTGFEKVVVIQTGKDTVNSTNNFFFGPVALFTGKEQKFSSTDGSLKGFQAASVLIMSGGALAEIGPISSAAIVSDGVNGWFTVGGSHGIAVLAAIDGSGWNATPGLSDRFAGLTDSLRWKIVSSTKNIRKLVGLGNQLFALSDTRLERMELSASGIATKVEAVTVAQLTDEQMCQSSSYSDCIITGPLGLLATSFGLVRSGNGVDIRMVSSPTDAQWAQVLLPESVGSLSAPGPASRLFAVTPTLDESDLIGGGTLYVLNGYVGLNQTLLYRFAVQSGGGVVTDGTVQLFPDYFIEGRKTFFANPGEYRNYIVTDGALLALSRSAYGPRFPFLELLSGVRARVLWFSVPEAHSMGKLIRNSASGAWIASGDFGARLLA